MMHVLNLPPSQLKFRITNGKKQVYDRLRKQFVRLTQEEYVRQHFIHFLIEHQGFPEGLLANEVEITLGNVKKRCDTILYTKQLGALVLIEYKAPNVIISQATFDQITRYNMTLRVPWLIVSNGKKHYCCHIDLENGKYEFLDRIPHYTDLLSHTDRL